MSFKVTIENFEGPIDALLQMIEKRKLAINDLSLAEITDDYIRFVSSLDNETLSNKTHFIFVASTLTLIKSKSLLPGLDLTEEEQGDIEDLKRRIELFKVFQESAQILKAKIGTRPIMFGSRSPKRSVEFNPHEGITLAVLRHSLAAVFAEVPEKPKLEKEATVRIAVHIEEMMDSLERRIQKAIKGDFNSFLGNYIKADMPPKQVRVYKVVGFLAMLELVKNGILHVLQDRNFSNIEIEKS